jgi:hypothetical protein
MYARKLGARLRGKSLPHKGNDGFTASGLRTVVPAQAGTPCCASGRPRRMRLTTPTPFGAPSPDPANRTVSVYTFSQQPLGNSAAMSVQELHGLTLESILTRLVDHYGWDQLGKRIEINCFVSDPSIKSSLKFLRKTPWARKKVEELYLETQFTH